MCRFRRDRVSISSGARKARSCVDFAEIVRQFRQVIDWGTLEIGSDLEKSSPRWRIVGRGSKSRKSTEEVEDQKFRSRNQQQQKQQHGRPSGRPWQGNSRYSRRTVDRSGRPSAEAAERSTARSTIVHDRAQQTCRGYIGRPALSTD